MKARQTTKEKLAEKLTEIFPDLVFDPKKIRRCFDSVKSGGHCYWSAEGREYTSFLRYKSSYFYGQNTMTDCVKNGIRIEDGIFVHAASFKLPTKEAKGSVGHFFSFDDD